MEDLLFQHSENLSLFNIKNLQSKFVQMTSLRERSAWVRRWFYFQCGKKNNLRIKTIGDYGQKDF